jgi:hypothetical protein
VNPEHKHLAVAVGARSSKCGSSRCCDNKMIRARIGGRGYVHVGSIKGSAVHPLIECLLSFCQCLVQ